MSSFLTALYGERLPMSDEQLLQTASVCGYNLGSTQYRVLIVSSKVSIENTDQFRKFCIELPNLCRRFLEKHAVRAETESDNAGNCIILLMDKTDKHTIERLSSSLILYLESKRFVGAVAAIGKPVPSISAVPYSYKTALNALHYESLFSNEKSLFIEDMQMTMKVSSLYSIVSPNSILEAFQAGDMYQLRNLVTLQAEKVRSLSGDSIEGRHPTSIRRMFIELTVYVLHLASDMGVDVDHTLEGIDPYYFLLAGDKSTPIIIDWFVSMCSNLRNAINEKAKAKERNVTQRACLYIHEHIAQYDLCLEEAALAVGLTPSYLSKLFHQDMGIGFSKYVIRHRIDMAKNLLRTTKLPIKEIAAQVGFSSANYFGTVFKRELQMSPQVYRQNKQANPETV